MIIVNELRLSTQQVSLISSLCIEKVPTYHRRDIIFGSSPRLPVGKHVYNDVIDAADRRRFISFLLHSNSNVSRLRTHVQGVGPDVSSTVERRANDTMNRGDRCSEEENHRMMQRRSNP